MIRQMTCGESGGDLHMKIGLRNGLWVILGVAVLVGVFRYLYHPNEIPLEYIGFIDTDDDDDMDY